MVIYNYANEETSIDLPNKPIKEINVIIISGDEVVAINFEDGEELEFDSSNCRLIQYYEGFYIVEGEKIDEWLSFHPDKKSIYTFAQQRKILFDNEVDDE